MRRGCLFLINLKNSVITVAIAAAGRVDQSGQEQRFAVFTGQIAVDKLRRLAVALAAALDLVDGRHGRREIRHCSDLVRGAMAIDTGCFITMRASADRPKHRAVTLATAFFVR